MTLSYFHFVVLFFQRNWNLISNTKSNLTFCIYSKRMSLIGPYKYCHALCDPKFFALYRKKGGQTMRDVIFRLPLEFECVKNGPRSKCCMTVDAKEFFLLENWLMGRNKVFYNFCLMSSSERNTVFCCCVQAQKSRKHGNTKDTNVNYYI